MAVFPAQAKKRPVFVMKLPVISASAHVWVASCLVDLVAMVTEQPL